MVLWVIAALSVLVLGLSQTTRQTTNLTQHHRATAEARALLEAGFILGAARHAWSRDSDRRDRQVFLVSDVELSVSVLPATGFVNLNEASLELLSILFQRGSGLALEDAESLAYEVVEWRDSAPRVPTEIVVSEPYRGRFRVVDDIMHVPGVSRGIYDGIREFVTLYSETGDINPLAAPSGVLNLISGGVVEAEVLLDGASDERRARELVADAFPEASFISIDASDVFRVDVRLVWKGRTWHLSRWFLFDRQAGHPLGVAVLHTGMIQSRPKEGPE